MSFATIVRTSLEQGVSTVYDIINAADVQMVRAPRIVDAIRYLEYSVEYWVTVLRRDDEYVRITWTLVLNPQVSNDANWYKVEAVVPYEAVITEYREV